MGWVWAEHMLQHVTWYIPHHAAGCAAEGPTAPEMAVGNTCVWARYYVGWDIFFPTDTHLTSIASPSHGGGPVLRTGTLVIYAATLHMGKRHPALWYSLLWKALGFKRYSLLWNFSTKKKTAENNGAHWDNIKWISCSRDCRACCKCCKLSLISTWLCMCRRHWGEGSQEVHLSPLNWVALT